MKTGKSCYGKSQNSKDFEDDYDFITSQLSIASKESKLHKNYWKVLIKNINGSYKSIASFIRWGKEEALDTSVLTKWKRNDDCYVFKFTEVDTSRKFETVNDWYTAEYKRQIGEPPVEDHEILMKRAIMALKLQSLLDFNRILYRPSVQYDLELEQPSWQDTPLAITCSCPTGDACSCCDRKAHLLPAKSIPWRTPGDILGLKIFCCFCCKPKGVFGSKLVKRVNMESEYYRSPKGRNQILAKGPEFCMSRCMQFMAASVKLDAKLAAEIGKMQTQIDSAGLESGNIYEAAGEKFVVPDVMDTSRICNAFTCTEATQTVNDPASEALLMGEYTHVLYGAPERTVMSDAEGTKLEISNYTYTPPDPCVFHVNDIFCMKGIKHQMTRIKKFYSSISNIDDNDFRELSCVCKGSGMRESMISILQKSSRNEHTAKGGNEKTKADVSSNEFDVKLPQCDKCYTPLEVLQHLRDSLQKYFQSTGEVCPCTHLNKGNPQIVIQESALKPIAESISKEDNFEIEDEKVDDISTIGNANGAQSFNDNQNIDDIKSFNKEIHQITELEESIDETKNFNSRNSDELEKFALGNIEALIKEKCDSKIAHLGTQQYVLKKHISASQLVETDDIIISSSRDDKIQKSYLMQEVSTVKGIGQDPYGPKHQTIDKNDEKLNLGEVAKKISRKESKFSWKKLFPSFISRSGSDKELKVTEYTTANSNQTSMKYSANPGSLTNKLVSSSSLNYDKSPNVMMKLSKSLLKKRDKSRSHETCDSSKTIGRPPDINKAVSQNDNPRKHFYRFYY